MKTRLKDSDEVHQSQYHVSKVIDLNILGRTAAGNLGISIDRVTKAVSPTSDESGKVSVNTVDVDTDLQKACQDLSKEFPSLWKSELGYLKDVELEVKFKPGMQPIFKKARPVPFAIQEDLNNAYAEGIAKGVWKPIQFGEYGTPVVPIRKAMLTGQSKPKLRVCGDYSITVHPQLEIHRQLMPLPQDLMQKLGGGHHFSKIDLADAYNQIRLAPENQRRLALSTHQGVLL